MTSTLESLLALDDAELEKQFQAAVEKVKTGPPDPTTSNEQKLKVYSLFKQANFGDNKEAAPWAVQLEKKAKWDAWTSVKGKTKQQAMAEYIMNVQN